MRSHPKGTRQLNVPKRIVWIPRHVIPPLLTIRLSHLSRRSLRHQAVNVKCEIRLSHVIRSWPKGRRNLKRQAVSVKCERPRQWKRPEAPTSQKMMAPKQPVSLDHELSRAKRLNGFPAELPVKPLEVAILAMTMQANNNEAPLGHCHMEAVPGDYLRALPRMSF